jgi:hypothetical protein
VIAEANRAKALQTVARLLGEHGHSLVVPRASDRLVIDLVGSDQLSKLQVGYGIGLDGRSLLGPEGHWQPHWLVIGTEALLGDPVFVDLDEPELPVCTARHGQDRWLAQPLAASLEELLMGRDR